MKYIKLFDIDSDRVSYEDSENYIEPYVSYVEEDYSVHYNKPEETKLVVYYDIQDISAPTTIFTNYDNSVKSIDIDGKETISEFSQGNVIYQFNSIGEHVVKFEFNNPTVVGGSAPLLYQLLTVKRVVIPDTFTAIGNSAFNGCSGLINVTIGNGVISITNSAFSGCTSLSSVTIPSSVTTIDNAAFQGCSSLTSIGSKDSNASVKMECINTYIGGNAFTGCSGLTTVYLPNGVTTITNAAFAGCSGITNITIPNSITSIGNGTFYNCSSLTSITIPNSVTSIGDSAFQKCSDLTSVTIEAITPPTLGSNAFSSTDDCPIYVPSESVDTYKSATNWSNYADRIQAIQE